MDTQIAFLKGLISGTNAPLGTPIPEVGKVARILSMEVNLSRTKETRQEITWSTNNSGKKNEQIMASK